MCVYVYVYLSVSKCMYAYVPIFKYTYMYIYIHICYVYIDINTLFEVNFPENKPKCAYEKERITLLMLAVVFENVVLINILHNVYKV